VWLRVRHAPSTTENKKAKPKAKPEPDDPSKTD
jgi:hypothetical protein